MRLCLKRKRLKKSVYYKEKKRKEKKFLIKMIVKVRGQKVKIPKKKQLGS
jgi:hypothetical protein